MKPLDEYIRKFPEQFDTDEPLPGHFDRFEQRLAMAGKRKISSGVYLLRFAAAIILGIVITYTAYSEFRTFNRNLGQSISMNPELREAEQFYSLQLDHYYSKLEDLQFDSDQSQKQLILKELSEMDKQVRTMKRDLRQNPDDERVVHAIINYYQVKLEFLDMVIARTQESNNTIL